MSDGISELYDDLTNSYQPVPVQSAQRLADSFSKEIIVIIAYDAVYQMTHVTTFGVQPASKDIAAQWGEAIPNILGCHAVGQTYEDFRATDLATYKRKVDEMQKLLTAASHALRSYQYGNAAAELAEEIADSIDQSLKTLANDPVSFNTESMPPTKKSVATKKSAAKNTRASASTGGAGKSTRGATKTANKRTSAKAK